MNLDVEKNPVARGKANGQSLKAMWNIRMATNDEGGEIKELMDANNNHMINVDWSEVSPYWVVADNGYGIVGCIQFLPGKPFTRVEFLCTHPDLSKTARYRLVVDLLWFCMALTRQMGAQIAFGTIPFGLDSYMRLLENNGGQRYHPGWVFAKSV